MSRLFFEQPTQRSTMVAVALPLPNEIETFLPQRGFVLELPVDTASKRIIDIATMKSVSTLVMPQAPKPAGGCVVGGWVVGGGVEVVDGGAGC
jgi:hypothetical protein